MTTRILFTSVCALLLIGESARAVNPSWVAGYPKTGTAAGTILTNATINIAVGYETTGGVQVTAWPVGGGASISKAHTIAAGQIGLITVGEFATDNTLTSGANYNVIVTILIKQINVNGAVPWNTDPAIAVAK